MNLQTYGNNLQGAAFTRPERNDKSPKGRAKKDIMVEIEGENERLEFRYMEHQINRKILKHVCIATFEDTVIVEMNTESHLSTKEQPDLQLRSIVSTASCSFTIISRASSLMTNENHFVKGPIFSKSAALSALSDDSASHSRRFVAPGCCASRKPVFSLTTETGRAN